jgi:clan AA aspartic protease
VGFTRFNFTVSHPVDLNREAAVELLVNTGAMISFVPWDVLEGLGVPRQYRRAFQTASGQVIERDVGVAIFRWNGYESVAPVAFAEPGDSALLGVTALESMGLVVDPVKRTLEPSGPLLV